MNRKMIPGIVVLVLVLVATQSIFTVHQTEKALILQLGEPMGETLLPGLHFKLPFIQNVLYFDARIINYDANVAEIDKKEKEAITKDKKVIILDNYSKWRIRDPLIFYQNLRTVNNAQINLKQIIKSEQLAVVGKYDLNEVVSSHRQEIMNTVKEQVNDKIQQYGVEVVDVRIKRTDLPEENQRAIFNRMTAERERQAMAYRSEGEKDATIIRANTDYERAKIIAEAKKQSEILRGEGDAEATRVFAEAVSQSPEFYTFSRSLEAYKKTLREKTRIVLNSDDSFLRFLGAGQ
ncbi:protein HflC [Deltaproteobacteria bacterium]|nr:protein HflC [Deltaproteobacteria bacterium]